MALISLLMIAVGLSMDAFAVCVNNGVTSREPKIKTTALLLPLLFGIFQALMTFAGWAIGAWASTLVAAVDHWIAFLILVAVGLRMLHEAFDEKNYASCGTLSFCTLLALSVATSIDAFAVGISLSFLSSSILDPVVIIGLTTFFLSLVGVYLGRFVGQLAGNRFEVLGALVLITIGVKILVQHLFFA